MPGAENVDAPVWLGIFALCAAAIVGPWFLYFVITERIEHRRKVKAWRKARE